jgi:hypothetical protein
LGVWYGWLDSLLTLLEYTNTFWRVGHWDPRPYARVVAKRMI